MVEEVSAKAHQTYERLHASGEFAELKRSYLGFVVPVTIGFMIWYFLYVVLCNWAPGLMGTKVVGNINVALAFGLLQFVTTFAITFIYARWANRDLDPAADAVGATLDGQREH